MPRTIIFASLAATILLAAGCAETPAFEEGPDAEVTHDGLTRVRGTIMDTVWARKDIDVRGYDKIIVRGVGVEYRPVKGPYSGRAGTGSLSQARNQTEFALDEQTRRAFEVEITQAFIEELKTSKAYEIVETPGPDVLAVDLGLLDVVSNVPPETIGRSEVFVSQVGSATLVLELRDSTSNAILVRAIDRRAAERFGGMDLQRSNSVTNRAEVRRLGRRWAGIVRDGLERLLADGVQEE